MQNSPRNVAMDYLSRREHSRLELETKLRVKGFEDDEIFTALERLVTENLQNDSRFAQSYLHYRISKGFGPLKIRHELKLKGLVLDVIKSAEKAEECDWQAQLKKVFQRKYGEIPAQDLKEKQKRSRFLQQRGFAMHDIMRLFANLK